MSDEENNEETRAIDRRAIVASDEEPIFLSALTGDTAEKEEPAEFVADDDGFVITDEDHTLGNSLRYVLARKYSRDLNQLLCFDIILLLCMWVYSVLKCRSSATASRTRPSPR